MFQRYFFLCLALFLCSCTRNDSKVVLELGNYQLDRVQLDALFDALPYEEKKKYIAAGALAKQEFLNTYAEKQLLVLEARERKIGNDPLVQARMTEASNQVLFDEIYYREITDKFVTEQMALEYYRLHPEDYREPDHFEVEHIVVTPRKEPKVHNSSGEDAGTDSEALQKLESLRARILAGEEFSELAKKYSEDQTAGAGGKIGWVSKGQLVEEFEKAVFDSPVGQVQGPVKTRYGYHLIRVIQKKNGNPVPFEFVKQDIKRKVASERSAEMDKVYRKLIADLRQRFPRKIHTGNLR